MNPERDDSDLDADVDNIVYRVFGDGGCADTEHSD